MTDRKELVKQANAAFAEGKPENFLALCAEDMKWSMVGHKQTNSKAEAAEWMKEMEGCEPPQFTVNTLISEGDIAVCTGDMTMKGEDGSPVEYGFCDVYTFDGDRIADLTSYIVKTGGKDEEQKNASAA